MFFDRQAAKCQTETKTFWSFVWVQPGEFIEDLFSVFLGYAGTIVLNP